MHYSRMPREHWIEALKCPTCGKTGVAEVSQTDELSWDTEVGFVARGFQVLQLEYGIGFYCISCSVPVEP